MFDDIQCDAVRCPLCGEAMNWQSKDGPCTMETLTVHELMKASNRPSFYTSCRDCGVWVEVTVIRETVLTNAQKSQIAKEKDIIAGKKKAHE
jgi:hypothetical protein